MSFSKPVSLNQKGVKEVYKSAYRCKILWESILPEEINRWLDVYQNATGCSKELIISSLIPLTASVCGPNTMVKNNKGHSQHL